MYLGVCYWVNSVFFFKFSGLQFIIRIKMFFVYNHKNDDGYVVRLKRKLPIGTKKKQKTIQNHN